MLQRSSQSIALSLCAAVLFMAWATITKADQSLSVSPISAEPSHEIHNGKVVWADLVTTDVRKAASFYQAVFDWVPNYTSDSGYVELSHNGQVICSIVDYEDDKATARDSRWLISISVPDVDAALTKVRDNGGEVLESATDLPDRGRYSVVSDTDLVYGQMTNEVPVFGASGAVDGFESVTNRISTATDDQAFMQLNVKIVE
jgi:predicted enzyme related to lactoylglutathione lyase